MLYNLSNQNDNMAEEKELIELTFEDLKTNVNSIISNSIPVWRKNKAGELVIIPLDRIDTFITGDKLASSIFYISSKWKKMIVSSSLVVKPSELRKRIILTDDESNADTYASYRSKIAAIPYSEREDHYQQILDSLQEHDVPGQIIEEEVMADIIEAVSVAFVISKTSFEDYYNDSKDIAPDHIKTIARNTTALVQGIIGILKKSHAANNFINLLGKKSTGTTVDHMYTVFMIFIPFCNFYNSYFSRGKIAKIRAEFKTAFAPYYSRFHLAQLPESLEDVFKGGMREIPPDRILQIGIGAFLHDIGKIDNIDYFEGEDKYDRKIIIKHAPISYNMIVKTREFDSEVAMLAALHHEYYNDSSGYAIAKILFPEENRKFKVAQHCLSYDLADVKSGLCLAYVPAKMLEIVDVFDALIDKKRKYREKEFTVDEALRIMKSDFIIKKTKLDPVLFAVFLDFINSHSILKDSSLVNNISFR